MRLTPVSTSQLLRRSTALSKAFGLHTTRGYNWGNYDVTPGECCKMQDDKTSECYGKKLRCKHSRLSNRCYEPVDESVLEKEAYSKKLLGLLRQNKVTDCDLIRHDVCYYEPSDKRRRYQRTWPECPLIWLRPKPICCPDPEHYPPIVRRKRKPPSPELSVIEKHAYNMKMLCRTPRMGAKIRRKCQMERKLTDCTKVPAPFPSFSECDQKYIQRYCPTECACKYQPSICELWRMHHRNSGLYKKCTQAIVGYCPFKRRSRFVN